MDSTETTDTKGAATDTPPWRASFVDVADPEKGPTPREWQTISRELRRPLDPATLDIMLDFHAKPRRGEGNRTVQGCVVYASRAAVMDRLDDVVGPGAWSGDYEALVMGQEVRHAKGWITVYGVAPKADVGSESKQANTMGAISHTWRRAADCWGVARYLRYLPELEVEVREKYRTEKGPVYEIAPAGAADLRERLGRWDGRPGTFPPSTRPPLVQQGGQQQQGQRQQGQQGQQQGARQQGQAGAARPAPAPAPAAPVAPAAPAAEERRRYLADAEITFTPAGAADEAEGADAGGEDGETASKVGQPGFISQGQLNSIKKLWASVGRADGTLPADIERWTGERAGNAIKRLSSEYQEKRRAATGQGDSPDGQAARTPVAAGARG